MKSKLLPVIIITILIYAGCSKSGPSAPSTQLLPAISTTPVSSVNPTTAISGGTISTDGGSSVTARGVCWSVTTNPTIANSKTSDGTGTGLFTSTITGLAPGTVYYVRAYATNINGTVYGSPESFTTVNTGIYLAGYLNNGTREVATVWKNGTPTALTNGVYDSKATSIFLSGNDVYVAGIDKTAATGITIATLWKNGIRTSLTNGTFTAEAWSVFVSGSDVYVAGNERNASGITVAKVWKNGIGTALTTGISSAEAYSVYVSGSDVYVAGWEWTGGFSIAKLWKNGVASSLSGAAYEFGLSTSVFISGTNVYVSGLGQTVPPAANNIATVWATGGISYLTNGFYNAQANSVYVQGTDVYVAGIEFNASAVSEARVWKNGVMLPLSLTSNTTVANSVYVNGTNVYVCGWERAGTTYIAKMWENGNVTNLSNGINDARIYSVFVK